jgi:hypothetical protein
MPGPPGSLLRLRGVLGYTALFFAVGALVPAANGQPTPDPVPGTTAGPTPDPAPLGRPRVVTQSSPVVAHAAPVVRTSTPSVVPRTAARAARRARAAPRATRARAQAKPQTVAQSVPRDAPVVLRTAAALVIDEPARAATTFAVVALFAVILASGSFLGVLVEVRRNLR